jgi:hypothetical protein
MSGEDLFVVLGPSSVVKGRSLSNGQWTTDNGQWTTDR